MWTHPLNIFLQRLDPSILAASPHCGSIETQLSMGDRSESLFSVQMPQMAMSFKTEDRVLGYCFRSSRDCKLELIINKQLSRG